MKYAEFIASRSIFKGTVDWIEHEFILAREKWNDSLAFAVLTRNSTWTHY